MRKSGTNELDREHGHRAGFLCDVDWWLVGVNVRAADGMSCRRSNANVIVAALWTRSRVGRAQFLVGVPTMLRNALVTGLPLCQGPVPVLLPVVLWFSSCESGCAYNGTTDFVLCDKHVDEGATRCCI